jgi:hypothetical protein
MFKKIIAWSLPTPEEQTWGKKGLFHDFESHCWFFVQVFGGKTKGSTSGPRAFGEKDEGGGPSRAASFGSGEAVCSGVSRFRFLRYGALVESRRLMVNGAPAAGAQGDQARQNRWDRRTAAISQQEPPCRLFNFANCSILRRETQVIFMLHKSPQIHPIL